MRGGPAQVDGGTHRSRALLLLLLCIGVGLGALRVRLGLSMLGFQLALACAGCSWALLVRSGARGELPLRWILVTAVVLRAVVLAGQPQLSDDVYRYAWEGEVVAHGLSPYAFPPDDPRLDQLRAELPELSAQVGHASIPAVYPPLAQAVHAATAVAASLLGCDVEERLLLLRVLYGLLDLCVLLPLAGLLRLRGLPAGLLVTWALCPVVLLSFAGTGHLDVLAILLLVAALHALERDRPLAAGLRLAAAVASKYLPLVAAAPVLVRAVRGSRRKKSRVFLRGLLVGLLLLGVPVLLLEGGELGLAGGLGAYGSTWEGGSLLFRHVDRLVRASGLAGGDPQLAGRVLVGLLWLAIFARALLREEDPVRVTGVAIGAWLVLTPTLHPWYLTWALPFLALAPRLSWTVLLALAPLLWWPVEGWQARGEWIEPDFVWPLLALPFMLLRGAEAFGLRAFPEDA